MPDTLAAVTAFCSGRYNANRDRSPGLATPAPSTGAGEAYLTIVNQARELQLSAADPERDLLDFLSRPHTDPDLVRACKEVLEHVGAR